MKENNNPQALTLRQALKQDANGNTYIFNELMYASYKANRDYGMTHAQAVHLRLGNTESLLRYNASKKA